MAVNELILVEKSGTVNIVKKHQQNSIAAITIYRDLPELRIYSIDHFR